MPEPAPREDYSTPKEPTVSDLGVEALEIAKPSITNLSAPILVQFVLSKVTYVERQLFLQASMNENVANSSGSHHTHVSATTIGCIFPPNPPSPVWTTLVSTTSSSGRGLIPSSVMTTTPFT
jgi:hypothetical protein